MPSFYRFILFLAVIGQVIRDLSYRDFQLLRKVEFRDCVLSLVCSADLNTTNFNIRASFFFFALQKISLSCDSPPAAGSYVALTVLGRPPGLPQIPLDEEEDSDVEKREEEEQEEGAEVSSSCCPTARPASERCPSDTSGAAPLPDGVRDTESSLTV